MQRSVTCRASFLPPVPPPPPAAGSDRRERTLDVLVPDADESYDPALFPPGHRLLHLPQKRPRPARQLLADEPRRGAHCRRNTMVFLDGLRLGKPHSQEEPFAMLSASPAGPTNVCTGVTVCPGRADGDPAGDHGRDLRPLTEAEIRAYIRTGDPMDKAGAYGVQGSRPLCLRHPGGLLNVHGPAPPPAGPDAGRFGVELLQ